MKSENNENLDELLKQFFTADEAKEATEDIAKGEQILRRYHAPVPNEETIAMVKARVAKAIARNRTRVSRVIFYRVAAVTAAIIVIGALSVRLFENKPAEPVKIQTAASAARSISEDGEFFNDDAELETLNAETEHVGTEIAALDWDTAGENGDADLINVEMKLLDIDSDFWKG